MCELVPLFDLSQPTVSHHLKVLRQAGIVGSEREGLWAYYYVIPDALKEPPMAELDTTGGSEAEQVRETVRARYAAAAQAAGTDGGDGAGAVPGRGARVTDEHGSPVFGATLYDEHSDSGDRAGDRWAPRSAVESRPQSPTCAREKRCSTSARERAPTY